MQILDRRFDTLSARQLHDLIRLRIGVFVVERVHFRGVDSEVLLRRPDGARLRFVFAEPPEVGATVRLRIDETRVVRWGTDPV